MNETLQGPPPPPRAQRPWLRDGHTLTLIIKREHLHLEWVCPHEGAAFEDLQTAPLCRIGMDDDGVESIAPDCLAGEHFDDLQAEAFSPDGDFPVTQMPVHVEWQYTSEEFYARPYQPDPTPTLPAAAAQDR